MSRREYSQPCSLACALDRIGERWSLLIVRELSLGPLRFSDLARSVGGAPTDVLTKRLRELAGHGIVRRVELEAPASGAAYELTELGRGGLNFEEVEEVERLAPTSLPSAIRILLRPPADAELTVGVRSGGATYTLRIRDGWVAGSRGESGAADVVLSGEPRDVLAALLAGQAGEKRVEIEGDRAALEALREMVELPARLRDDALAEVDGLATARTA